MIMLKNQKRINFKEQLDVFREEGVYDELLDKSVQNTVSIVDNGTLVKNLERPYLFITAKQYADALQMEEADDSRNEYSQALMSMLD